MDWQVIINGILLGGLYGLAAVGFSLIWGVMNIVDLTQGAYLTLGAYITFWLFKLWGIDPFLTLPVSALILFGLAFLIESQIIKRVLRYGFVMLLVVTYGLNLLLQNAMLVAWSADYRSVTPAYSGAGFSIGSVNVPYIRLALFIAALLLVGLLTFFLNKTRLGNAIRATALNRLAANLVGVRTEFIYALTYSLAAALVGMAGSLISMVYTVSPSLGGTFMTKIFVVTVLGGFGSLSGAVLGGLILGITEALTASYIAPGLMNAVSFILLVVILIFRPQGLMGKQFYGA
ncbi:ABC transporter, permease [Moorella glycerini]|uniref:High-affinity branched-chain amino acid transport system permease protein LivH n=1 Tax=Neomoorella stamsii TaxID=1266720 RepID=A0A9X7J3X6_9FIRM|nr:MULTISPECIES: branched-chain amino acid ABC transporter permease [Moorella]PRR73455.1 High-affinity branched-chain amino acid transport system permease protein LivH [Moorella stamsii]CEP69224.1 ABC transporter, permease [Moorella glycerini]